MTTTGYGDIYPKTFAGRLFGVISFIIGNVLISLMVVTLSGLTAMLPMEVKAYHTIKKIMAIEKSNEKAADVIRAVMIYKKIRTIRSKIVDFDTMHGRHVNKLNSEFYRNLKKKLKIFKKENRSAIC